MLTQKSDQISKLRTIDRYGDLAMLVQFIKSSFIKDIYQGQKKVIWSVIIWMFKAKIDMLALLSRSVFRYNFGRHTTGILMTIWALCMVIAFNHNDPTGYLFSFVPFGAPVLLINISWLEFQQLVWYQTASKAVEYWLGLCTFFQLIHVSRVYLEVGNTSDHMKRGDSWLYSGILKTKYISEYQIQCIVEPCLTALVGYAVWEYSGDRIFLILALASALSLFLQEFSDGAYRYYHSRF